MDSVFRSLIRSCGIMLLVLGVALLLTCIVSLLSREWDDGLNYLWMGILYLFIGGLCRFLCKRTKNRLHLGDGFFLVTMLWILMSAFGALPFMVTGVATDPVAAFFESCSGFTTTGATVLSGLSKLPHGIMFWRAMTCWLGGAAILLIAITLMPALGLNGQRLNTPDNYGPVLEQVSPRMLDNIRTILLLYTGLTLIETLLLKCFGMSLFNALVHSMATVSTGGFSRYDDGIAHFGGCGIPLVISLFMIISGLNWFLFLHRPKNSVRNFLRNSEIHMYGFLLGCAFVLISTSCLIRTNFEDPLKTICDAAMGSASFLSTTGFYSCDYGVWPEPAQFVLLLLMFCGACTASAGGGIKAARVSILMKLVRHGISTRLHARFFEPVKMNGQSLGSDTVSGTATMPFLYLTSLFAGTFLLTLGDVTLSEAFNASIACLCNTGHAFGSLGPGSTFAVFGAPSQCLLSLMMIGGRLEMYAIIILLTPKFWSQSH